MGEAEGGPQREQPHGFSVAEDRAPGLARSPSLTSAADA